MMIASSQNQKHKISQSFLLLKGYSNMRVSGFMKPADEVVTVAPTDSIRKAMDLMISNKVGCLVVVPTGHYQIPIGLVTKSDIIKAYYNGLASWDHECKEVMTTSDALVFCNPHMNRDEVAKVLEKNRIHHAIVADPSTNRFIGLVSSWDITVECAKDDRAWPWNRAEDGKFHNQVEETQLASSPNHTLDYPTSNGSPKLGDSFRAYVDNLQYMDM